MSSLETIRNVANDMWTMYMYQYVCTSLIHNTWYEFKNHRWVVTNLGVSLRRKIGNELCNQYIKLITYYNQYAYDHPEEKDQYLQKAIQLTNVTYDIQDYAFKEKIIKECRVMFYDSHFIDRLDTNPDLVGYENGVYNRKTGEFRDGQPDDYISLTTGVNYI